MVWYEGLSLFLYYFQLFLLKQKVFYFESLIEICAIFHIRKLALYMPVILNQC